MPQRHDKVGSVYLLHFDRPLDGGQRPRHYIGWALDVDERVAKHLAGDGSRLVRAVVAAGIGVTVARVWTDTTPVFERALKSHNFGPMDGGLCPLCAGVALEALPSLADLEARRRERKRLAQRERTRRMQLASGVV